MSTTAAFRYHELKQLTDDADRRILAVDFSILRGLLQCR